MWFAIASAGRRIGIVSASALLLAGCAHAGGAIETSLTGVWEGVATPPAGAGSLLVALELMDNEGTVSGSGRISSADAAGQRSRPVEVTGTFRSGHAELTLEVEDIQGATAFRGRAAAPDTLVGALHLVLPRGIRLTNPPPGYPLNITLARSGGR
jgi:hypothetical protein